MTDQRAFRGMIEVIHWKLLALLKETLPKASPVAALWNPANPVW